MPIYISIIKLYFFNKVYKLIYNYISSYSVYNKNFYNVKNNNVNFNNILLYFLINIFIKAIKKFGMQFSLAITTIYAPLPIKPF